MTSLMPSRKWIAAQVAAIGTLLAALIQNGWELTTDLQVVLLGIVIQAIVTYLVPSAKADSRPAPTPARQPVLQGG